MKKNEDVKIRDAYIFSLFLFVLKPPRPEPPTGVPPLAKESTLVAQSSILVPQETPLVPHERF